MPDQDGFEIYKRFYPSPTRFRMGDPVLVTEVTGMTWPEFTAALDAMETDYASLAEQGRADEFQADHTLLLGLMAVAFWQGNPTMSRAKVVRAIERIPIDDVDFIAADTEEDVGPPAQTAQEADGNAPTPTSSESDGSPEDMEPTEIHLDFISDETSLNTSGAPGVLRPPLASPQS